MSVTRISSPGFSVRPIASATIEIASVVPRVKTTSSRAGAPMKRCTRSRAIS